MSPTARSLQLLRARGYTANVVEKWNQYARIRQDLFGIIDIVAMKRGENGLLGVQATTGENVSHRAHKALENPSLELWLDTGNRFQVWGFAKQGARGKRKIWTLRRLQFEVTGGGLVNCLPMPSVEENAAV